MRAVGCECQANRCFAPSVELDLDPLQILCQRRVDKVHAAKVVGRYDRQGLHVVCHTESLGGKRVEARRCGRSKEGGGSGGRGSMGR